MTSAPKTEATAAQVTHWRNAVVVAYGASGLAFASWVSRLPAIRDALDLSPGNIGVILLCMTLGSFASVSASGLIVLRLGSKRTIRTGSIMVGAGLLTAGFGTTVLASPVATAIGLAIIGLGTGSWNTASNVEGAAVERAERRTDLPHAVLPPDGEEAVEIALVEAVAIVADQVEHREPAFQPIDALKEGVGHAASFPSR